LTLEEIDERFKNTIVQGTVNSAVTGVLGALPYVGPYIGVTGSVVLIAMNASEAKREELAELRRHNCSEQSEACNIAAIGAERTGMTSTVIVDANGNPSVRYPIFDPETVEIRRGEVLGFEIKGYDNAKDAPYTSIEDLGGFATNGSSNSSLFSRPENIKESSALELFFLGTDNDDTMPNPPPSS
jgi:hypothetical protein